MLTKKYKQLKLTFIIAVTCLIRGTTEVLTGHTVDPTKAEVVRVACDDGTQYSIEIQVPEDSFYVQLALYKKYPELLGCMLGLTKNPAGEIRLVKTEMEPLQMYLNNMRQDNTLEVIIAQNKNIILKYLLQLWSLVSDEPLIEYSAPNHFGCQSAKSGIGCTGIQFAVYGSKACIGLVAEGARNVNLMEAVIKNSPEALRKILGTHSVEKELENPRSYQMVTITLNCA